MSDWEKKVLGEAVLEPITYGIVQPGDFTKNGVPLIRGKDYMQGWAEEGDFFRVSHELHEKYKRSKVTRGDLLLSIAGYVGEVAIVPKWIEEANITQTTARIRCDEKILNSKYLLYFFQSNEGKEISQRFSKGSAQAGLNLADIAKFEIPIPPLPEQKKIAEILSGIDTQRQALAKKATNASMLRNALGEKIFSSLDGERVPLGELCNPKQWQTISTNQLTTSGYPVYGANGKIGYFTEYNHKEPVLAVTCRGATCGNLTLVPAFSYVTGNSMCLDNPREDTSPEYLFQFLSWRGLKDVISGSAQPQITRSPLQAVEVVLPSKERQDKIVSALESVNNAENIMNIALGRLDLLRQAIAADLLSGRKRVSV